MTYTPKSKWLVISLLLLTSFIQGCSLAVKDESEWTVQDFYQNAKDGLDTKRWDVAIQYYEKLKAFYPYGKYAEQSYLELAYAYYSYNEPESAKRELDEFIRLYPKHTALPYAYYLKALASDSINKSMFDDWFRDPAKRDMSSTKDAYQAYLRLIKAFPKSEYAKDAKRRIVVLHNRIARHELQVGQYYYDREAYLAAANRAQQIIEQFSDTTVNHKALVLLRDSYIKLGMTQNAQDTQKVLDYNLKQAKQNQS